MLGLKGVLGINCTGNVSKRLILILYNYNEIADNFLYLERKVESAHVLEILNNVLDFNVR